MGSLRRAGIRLPVRFCCLHQGFDVLSELGSVIIHGSGIGHDHVELARVKGQIPQDFHLLFHVGHVVIFQPGGQVVFLDLDPEPLLFQNFLDEMHAPELSVGIGGPALELEADVVFAGPFADQGLDR